MKFLLSIPAFKYAIPYIILLLILSIDCLVLSVVAVCSSFIITSICVFASVNSFVDKSNNSIADILLISGGAGDSIAGDSIAAGAAGAAGTAGDPVAAGDSIAAGAAGATAGAAAGASGAAGTAGDPVAAGDSIAAGAAGATAGAAGASGAAGDPGAGDPGAACAVGCSACFEPTHDNRLIPSPCTGCSIDDDIFINNSTYCKDF